MSRMIRWFSLVLLLTLLPGAALAQGPALPAGPNASPQRLTVFEGFLLRD